MESENDVYHEYARTDRSRTERGRARGERHFLSQMKANFAGQGAVWLEVGVTSCDHPLDRFHAEWNRRETDLALSGALSGRRTADTSPESALAPRLALKQDEQLEKGRSGQP